MALKEQNCGKRKCPLLDGDLVPVVYCEIAPCFSGIGVEGCRHKPKCSQSLMGWSADPSQ